MLCAVKPKHGRGSTETRVAAACCSRGLPPVPPGWGTAARTGDNFANARLQIMRPHDGPRPGVLLRYGIAPTLHTRAKGLLECPQAIVIRRLIGSGGLLRLLSLCVLLLLSLTSSATGH